MVRFVAEARPIGRPVVSENQLNIMIIGFLVKGKDVSVSLPTGAGKSLLFLIL